MEYMKSMACLMGYAMNLCLMTGSCCGFEQKRHLRYSVRSYQ